MDIITIILPDMEEPIYCSIMGRGGECFAIAAYLGFDAINNFYKIVQNQHIPDNQMIRYQDDNVIICYFGDREELSDKEWQLIRDLELKFRGKNNWIYFYSFKRGYAPYMLDEDEVLLETEVLKHLYVALQAYIINGIKVDFEKGNTLLRIYDEEKKLWANFEAPIPIKPMEYFVPVLQDDSLISGLKKQKNSGDEIEIDIAYLNSIINDKKYPRPILPRICLAVSHNKGFIINQSIIHPEGDDIQEVFSILINYIMDVGKPKTVYVRDEYIMSILKDLCERTNIRLKISGRLKAIDTFIEEFDRI